MTRRGWWLFLAISLLWGLPYLLIKVAVAELDPVLLVFLRAGIAAVVLLPVALANGALKAMLPRWRAVVLLAGVEIVGPFLLIAYGEQHITSSLAGILIAADPLFIALLALKFDASERATRRGLVGLCVGLVGVATLLGLSPGGDALAPLGGAMILLAALSYAGGALVIKRAFSDIPPLGSVAASLSLAALVLLPLATTRLPQAPPSATAIASLLGLSIVCTAIAFLTYFSLIAEAGATRAALITYVNPVVAVILGVLILGEPVTLATLAGFALIVFGCWLSTTPAARQASAEPATRIASASRSGF
jgi:drug/metabolite transporter (DMT)-like permease